MAPVTKKHIVAVMELESNQIKSKNALMVVANFTAGKSVTIRKSCGCDLS